MNHSLASVLCALLLFSFADFAWAQGVVASRKGYVQVNGRAVEAGDPFRSASVAVTESESSIRVSYADSSFVHAGPNTNFSAVASADATMVTLNSGWVWVRAGADRLITVNSGDAKVEGQGADFIFRHAGSPRVLVLDGVVRLSDGGSVRTVDGEELSAAAMPLLSDLSPGSGASIEIERKFLLDVMTRLKAANNGMVSQGVVRDGKPQGVFETWSGKDGLRLRLNYREGALHGPYASFYGDNRPETIGRYEGGVKAGTWTSYYENGRVSDEGEYRGGVRSGVWKFYSTSGKLVRVWDYTKQGLSAIPRWQWGLAYLGAFQEQGDFQTVSALLTRCLYCDSFLSPRFDITTSWLKFQEQSSGAAFGAHAGLDVVVGPVVARVWLGGEYLLKDPFRTSIGAELTRAVGRDMHARDWQPFVRVSLVEMGSDSDITLIQVGLWETF